MALLMAFNCAAAAPPWPHEGSDIVPDASVTWGALDNGVRYAVMPHNDPPDRVSLRLYVDTGSVMEEDDQQGVAHFLEHMAFNGTTHFPAGEMVEYFQRLGMAFGADTNAHTSFKETVYKLDLPRTDEKLLGGSMQLLRDYADGMLFLEEEIDKERGVILSEKLLRDSADFRLFVERLKFNLPDSIISERLPIGTEETISSVPQQRFLNFYEKYYVPSRMVVVAVGDVDPAAFGGLVKEYFASLDSANGAAPDPDLGEVSTRGVVALFHPEEEASSTYAMIESIKPFAKPSDSLARRATELRLGLADRILSRRFEILSKKDDAAFLYGRASSSDMLDFVSSSSIRMTTKPESWKEALAVGEQELRRALSHGFTDAELAEAKANVKRQYERRAATAATRKSRDLANAIVSRLSSGLVFTDPLMDVERVSAELEKATAEECLEAFRAAWTEDDLNVFVSGKIDMEKDAGREAVMAAYLESREIAVSAPVEEETKAFAYGAEMAPGAIASQEYVEDLDITTVAFENGVRLNVKKTDFEKDTIQVQARVGGGKLTQSREKPGLATFVESTFTLGGLEEHTNDELKRIFAGTTVNAGFSVSDDAFVLSGKTKPEDFLSQLQVMKAYLTAPAYREEAQGQFRRSVDALYQQLEHTTGGVMQNEVAQFVRSGDTRFGYPSKAEMLEHSQSEARAWLAPQLESGYLEIAVVGDLGVVEGIVDQVARTFGALPKRAKDKPGYEKERAVSFPSEREAKRFFYESEIPKSGVGVYWKTDDIWDIQRSRRLNILASVMRDRMRIKIREELGDAYSPYARSTTSDVYTGYGYLVSIVESDREKAGMLASILQTIGEELKADGINEDELERAIEPLMNMLTEYRRNNSYWLQRVLQSCQEHPQRLDWARSIMTDYGEVTVEEVSALAREYLGAAKALKVLVVSEDAKDSG